jgi:hypothetical protein
MAEQTVPIQRRLRETERRAWVRYAKDEEVWCQPLSTKSEEELDPAWLGRLRNSLPAGPLAPRADKQGYTLRLIVGGAEHDVLVRSASVRCAAPSTPLSAPPWPASSLRASSTSIADQTRPA